MTVSLQWFGEKIKKEVASNVKAAVHDVAKLIESTAKSGVPSKTGKLKRSIRTVETEKDGTFLAYVKAGSRSKGGAYYAGFVELGTERIKANPFLRRAIRKHKKAAQKKLAKAVKKALR